MRNVLEILTGISSYFFGRYVAVPLLFADTEFDITKVVMVALSQFLVGGMWFVMYQFSRTRGKKQ